MPPLQVDPQSLEFEAYGWTAPKTCIPHPTAKKLKFLTDFGYGHDRFEIMVWETGPMLRTRPCDARDPFFGNLRVPSLLAPLAESKGTYGTCPS